MYFPAFKYDFELYANEKDFQKGIIKDAWSSPNLVTKQGKNSVNDVYFNDVASIYPWYVLLFNSDTTPVDTMTYAVPVFTESSAYDETVRQLFQSAASVNEQITNTANRARFTINAATTLYGCGLVGGGSSPSVKGNTAGGGILHSVTRFAAPRVVATPPNILLVVLTTIMSTGTDDSSY